MPDETAPDDVERQKANAEEAELHRQWLQCEAAAIYETLPADYADGVKVLEMARALLDLERPSEEPPAV
jgi:hypothetical protein